MTSTKTNPGSAVIRSFVPLLAAIVVTSSAAQAASTTRVNIVLTSHRFTPSPVHLSGGVPVRLTIANQSGETHDFYAPEFFHWSRIQRGKVPGGKLRLRSGERAVVTLTPRRGSYKLKCTRFGHAFLGMSTMIIVH